MRVGMIGTGAIGRYVQHELQRLGFEVSALLVRPEREAELAHEFAGLHVVSAVRDLPSDLDHVVDCAGHTALAAHGPDILRRGLDLTTVSIGALADSDLQAALETAATAGDARLLLASGAIGALDCLRAAGIGALQSVTYTGRKPPAGWLGSPAEAVLDLEQLGTEAETHFEGSAREAAIRYPNNANVAAAVALAGLGFDDTRVQLIADPTVDQNIHQIAAAGEFGDFAFEIRGHALPGNPKSSALAAMSAVSVLEQERRRIRF